VIAFLKDEVKIVLSSPPFGRTALHLACRSGSSEAVQALATGVSDLRTFLHPAWLPEVRLYLDPLGEAVISGSLSAVRECLSSFDCADEASGSSAMTLAAMTGRADIMRALALAFPSINTDEALSVATVQDHESIGRLLNARSRFVRTDIEAWVMDGLGDEALATLEGTGSPDCLDVDHQ
jgi:ankyrin repeat protein